jgi:hypothetical protein
VVFLLWSCTAFQSPTDDSGARECGPLSSSEEGCLIDVCASTCTSVESGIACCVESYGHGGFDDSNLERLLGGCSGDGCDQDLYLSPQAALCAAQVHGLESGIGWCGLTFEFLGDEATWIGVNTYVNECADGGDSGDVGYNFLQIDARTGEYLQAWQEIGLAECAE